MNIVEALFADCFGSGLAAVSLENGHEAFWHQSSANSC